MTTLPNTSLSLPVSPNQGSDARLRERLGTTVAAPSPGGLLNLPLGETRAQRVAQLLGQGLGAASKAADQIESQMRGRAAQDAAAELPDLLGQLDAGEIEVRKGETAEGASKRILGERSQGRDLGFGGAYLKRYNELLVPRLASAIVNRQEIARDAALADTMDGYRSDAVTATDAAGISAAVTASRGTHPSLTERQRLAGIVLPTLHAAADANNQEQFDAAVSVLGDGFGVEIAKAKLALTVRQARLASQVANDENQAKLDAISEARSIGDFTTSGKIAQTLTGQDKERELLRNAQMQDAAGAAGTNSATAIYDALLSDPATNADTLDAATKEALIANPETDTARALNSAILPHARVAFAQGLVDEGNRLIGLMDQTDETTLASGLELAKQANPQAAKFWVQSRLTDMAAAGAAHIGDDTSRIENHHAFPKVAIRADGYTGSEFQVSGEELSEATRDNWLANRAERVGPDAYRAPANDGGLSQEAKDRIDYSGRAQLRDDVVASRFESFATGINSGSTAAEITPRDIASLRLWMWSEQNSPGSLDVNKPQSPQALASLTMSSAIKFADPEISDKDAILMSRRAWASGLREIPNNLLPSDTSSYPDKGSYQRIVKDAGFKKAVNYDEVVRAAQSFAGVSAVEGVGSKAYDETVTRLLKHNFAMVDGYAVHANPRVFDAATYDRMAPLFKDYTLSKQDFGMLNDDQVLTADDLVMRPDSKTGEIRFLIKGSHWLAGGLSISPGVVREVQEAMQYDERLKGWNRTLGQGKDGIVYKKIMVVPRNPRSGIESRILADKAVGVVEGKPFPEEEPVYSPMAQEILEFMRTSKPNTPGPTDRQRKISRSGIRSML